MNQDNLILKKNMLLNIMKTFLSIIFPLITYPYITRILLVENLGKISFTNSIVNVLINLNNIKTPIFLGVI